MLLREKNLNEKNLEKILIIKLTVSYIIKILKIFIVIMIIINEPRIMLAWIESIIIYTIITIVTIKLNLDII